MDQRKAAALELLRWQLDSGVDLALEEAVQDRFAEAAETRRAPSPAPGERATERLAERPSDRPAERPSSPPRTLPPRGQPRPQPALAGLADAVLPDEAAIGGARERAAAATSLAELREAMAAFEGCNLKRTARSLVFGEGDPNAALMLIGEAPGREEDETGRPFVGRSGRLLERMLGAIGLTREAVYITNVIPWRPPGNRTPTVLEMEVCRPFLERHVELVAPRLIGCLGGPAVRALTGRTDGILKLRGSWLEVERAGRIIPALPMLHPAYLLRQPVQKRLAWADMLALKAALAALPER